MFASRMMMKGEGNEEMKTRCELREKGAIHSNRKRGSVRYKINTGKIRRIRKSISCLVSN
jgi:DNA-binding transcriptional ArsR family regulator